MKIFILACLLAVALAKQKMEQQSSSEESINISQEKFKKYKKLAVIPNEEIICSPFCKETAKNIPEMASSSSSSSEEFADVSTENKKDQYQVNFLQYLQALSQRPIVMQPWNQIQTRPYPIAVPTLDREQISTIQDIVKKTSDMESTEKFTEKKKMDEVQKIFQSILNKIHEYYKKIFWTRYPESVDQNLEVIIPWTYIKPNADQVNVPLGY